MTEFSKIEWHRHINPDGSVGGYVASTAKVAESAVLDYFSYVWPDAVVPDHTRLEPGTVCIGEGVIVYPSGKILA